MDKSNVDIIITSMQNLGVKGSISKNNYGYLVRINGEIYHILNNSFKADLERVIDVQNFLKLYRDVTREVRLCNTKSISL